MIFYCENCKKEINLNSGASYCPFCGKEIKKIDLCKRVLDLYKEGYPLKEISRKEKISEALVEQQILKAVRQRDTDEKELTDKGLIQPEYEERINEVLDEDPYKGLKEIKEVLPEECSYMTVNYYADKRKNGKREMTEKASEMIRKGCSIEDIREETGVSQKLVERLVLQEMDKDPETAKPYEDTEYEEAVMKEAESPEWDGKTKSIYEALEGKDSYLSIKITLKKNGKNQ